MSAVLLLIIMTLVFALMAARFGYQPKISAAIAGTGGALIGLFLWFAPLDDPFQVLGVSMKFSGQWTLLGRAFVMDSTSRPVVFFLYLSGAFLVGGGWMARASRYLTSVGLIMVSLIALSLLVQPFLYAAILLELAAMGAVLVLVSDRHPKARGGLRLLFLYSLAMMVILLAGRILDIGGITATTPALAWRVSVLLALGFGILMAVPPFHLWIPSSARDLNIYAVGFTATLLQSAGLFLLLRFLDAYEWMRTNETLGQLILAFGLLSIWIGGLAALSKREARQVLAYGLVVDFGVTLLAVGVGAPNSLRLALGMAGARIISLAVAALGLVNLEYESDGSPSMGIGWVAALVGLMSLAGLPLLAGFPGRWALLEEVSRVNVILAGSLVFGAMAIGGASIGALTSGNPARAGETLIGGRTARLFLMGGVGLCLLFGLLPDLLYPWIADMITGFGNLVP